YDYSSDVLVEPVHGVDNLSRLPTQEVGECRALATRGRYDQETGGLGYDEEMLVLVEDADRRRHSGQTNRRRLSSASACRPGSCGRGSPVRCAGAAPRGGHCPSSP